MQAYFGSRKELEMQNKIKDLKQEIRRTKEEAEKVQQEIEMVFQDRLDQLNQKYKRLLKRPTSGKKRSSKWKQ